MREERKQTLAADLDRFNKAMKDVGESDSEWEEGVTTKASKNNKRRKTAANDVSISSNDDDEESEEEDNSAVPSKLSEKQIFAAEDDNDDEATVTIEEMDEGNSQFAFAEKTVEQLKAPLKKKSSTSLEASIFKSQNSEDEEGYGVKTEDYIDFTKNKTNEAKQKKKKFRYLTKTERKQKVSKEKGRSKEKRSRAKK
ncbi:hypothetical protein D0Z03_000782 [Geotrichum reessii]|nr:hypothetical protein D0Z03_000782 [Galactomyces reessii]